MSPERTLTWLGREKERRALELCSDHLEKIAKTTGSMNEVVHSFAANQEDIEEKKEATLEMEREADDIKEEVLGELSKGSFPPLNREMIVRLCMTVDDIGDNSRAAAAKLAFVDFKSVDQDVKDGLVHLSDKAYETVEALEEVFSEMLHEDIDDSIEKLHDIERMEEEVDDFRAKTLKPKLVAWSNELKEPGTSRLIDEVESNIEEVVDQTENSADIMRQIAISTS